jgi:hypothetical protein
MNQALQEAEQLFEQPKPAPTMTAYEREQQVFFANYERLKAERLVRNRKI